MKKLLIVGPGGLGGTIAALLARKGECDVTVVGRPGAHIDTIQRQRALRLTGLQEFAVQIDATDDPKSIRECDILIYTVKAQDTEAALTMTEHIQVRDFVASLQNGAVKDELLVDVFGSEKVLGGLAVVAGERPTPGVVNWTYDGGTQFGELDGGTSERVDEIVNLFQNAGLITQASDAILSATWSKMVGWIPIGLLATLSRQTNAGVFSNRQLAPEYLGMVRELQALAAAKGIPLIDLGPYHVKTWCQGTAEEAIEKVLTSPLSGSQSTHSALQDIQKGITTEFQACVGPILEEAQALSIPMQRVQIMYATLMGLEDALKRG
jgi:2-dehydropantoate 2-reductase